MPSPLQLGPVADYRRPERLPQGFGTPERTKWSQMCSRCASCLQRAQAANPTLQACAGFTSTAIRRRTNISLRVAPISTHTRESCTTGRGDASADSSVCARHAIRVNYAEIRSDRRCGGHPQRRSAPAKWRVITAADYSNNDRRSWHRPGAHSSHFERSRSMSSWSFMMSSR